MANPAPDTPPARRLVWAPDEVRVRVDPPRIGTGRLVTTAALTGLVFTWPPAFLVLTAATLAAPSLTDGAGIGTTARWAAQIAVLVAIGAVVTVLRRRDTPPEVADPDPAPRAVALRVALHAVVTGGSAAVVLAWQGLAVGQVTALAVALVVVLHLLPLSIARLVSRRQAGGTAGSRP